MYTYKWLLNVRFSDWVQTPESNVHSPGSKVHVSSMWHRRQTLDVHIYVETIYIYIHACQRTALCTIAIN